MDRNASGSGRGDERQIPPDLRRVRLTFILGLILVFSTAGGLLWILGVLPYDPYRKGSDQALVKITPGRLVQITPDCVVNSHMHIQFDVFSFDSGLLQMSLDLPSGEGKVCKSILVASNYQLTPGSSAGSRMPFRGESEGDHDPRGTELTVRQEPPTANYPRRFSVSLETIPYPKSVFLQFRIHDPVSMKTFSDGEVKGTFFVSSLMATRIPSFLLILHNDIRVTSRDVDARFDDPRLPNIYRYEPTMLFASEELTATRSVRVDFGVEFPNRDRLKETLLVILSALFGVGVSALFESLLASEIYAALAGGLFGSSRITAEGQHTPAEDTKEQDSDENDSRGGVMRN